MMTLSEQAPAWAAGYIGIEFADRGRDRCGLDCWGLTRLVYAERYGVYLPSHSDGYEHTRDRVGVPRLFDIETASQANRPSRWATIETNSAQVGDLISFRIAGIHGHVGIVVARHEMLHAVEGTRSCLERFDGRLWSKRVCGVWRYAGPVRMVGRPTFLSPDRIDVELPSGLTIAELVEASGIPITAYLRVFLGDREIEPERWDLVRPKPGRVLTVTAVAAGGQQGGKTALRVVATIAIIAIAAYTGGATVAAYGKFAGAVVTAAIGVAGTLAINALIPIPQPRLSLNGGTDVSDTISQTIASGRNGIQPYGKVPAALGTYRWAPPYGAKPYVEIQGDAQYLRCLFCLGEGPLDISEARIGSTDLMKYEGVEIEIRAGLPDDPPITIFPNAIITENLSVLLTQAASWTQRTSALAANELSVDITFSQGLVNYQLDGKKGNATVEVAVEFRKVGEVGWSSVNGGGLPAGSPTSEREMDLLFRTPESPLGGEGTHTNDINWSAGASPYPDAKPDYLPTNGYAWMAEGWFFAPVPGDYRFCLDSADAADLQIDGRTVVKFYGSHGPEVTFATLNSSTRVSAPIALTRGWHQIRARVECRTLPGGTLAVGWKKPFDAIFTILPQANLSTGASGKGANSLRYRWHTNANYTSGILTTAARTDPVRRTLSWAVPDNAPNAQYEVRLRRTTADTSSNTIFDKVYWAALRTITSKDPLPIPGVAKIALRIRATDQLNGVIDEFNTLTKSVVPDWDSVSGLWITRATSNPASIYRRMLNGSASDPFLADARIDLTELRAWHEECDSRGLAFNGVIDFSGTLRERLQDVAAAGRATPSMRDGLFSIVRDRPQSVPRQHFTPANSRGFTGKKSFPDLPHAFKVQFMDKEINYQRNERVVPDDAHTYKGLDAFGNARPDLPEASKFETLEVFGCTSMDEGFRHGRYTLAVAKLRPETFELETDIEHMVANRGDLVMVTHDVPLWGQGWGRVTGLVTDTAGNVKALKTDNEIVMAGGQLYRVRVRLETGATFLRDVVTVEGISHLITLASLEPAAGAPKVGDLYMFGPPGQESRELIIKSIEINHDLSAKLSLVDHAPAVHLADQGVIPPYDSGITQDANYNQGPEDPVITAIRSDDLVMIRDADGSLRNRMVISLLPAGGTRPIPSHVQVRTRPKPEPPAEAVGSWIHHPTTPIDNNEVSVTDVEQGVTYQIRLRVVTPAGLTSNWVAAEHTIIGKSFPPPDVQSFDVLRLSDGTRRYSWVLGVVPPDIAGVHIRYGPLGSFWEIMLPVHEDVLQSSPSEVNAPPAGSWTFGIKMVDTSGIESVNAIYLDKTLGQERLEGVAFSDDAAIAGWPGTKTNCHVANYSLPSSLLEPDDPTTWSDLPGSGAGTWDAWNRWILSPRTPIVYEHTALDAGFVFEFSPDARWSGDGRITVELAWSVDNVAYTPYAEVSTVRQVAVMARYLKARVTAIGDVGVPIPTITRLLVTMRAESVISDLNDVVTSALPATSIIAVGDVRLPIEPGRFKLIRSVSLSFNGQGPGWSWELVDRDLLTGPRVRMYNADRVLSHATVDAVVRGL